MRLDDLYKMTAYIYQDANTYRSREATYLHFVEVCTLLTEVARKKKRQKVDIGGAICKALGWYFPLLAKMGVESVEALVFHKYPTVCPYCRQAPHKESRCKLVLGSEVTVDHAELASITKDNWSSRPKGLNEWQAMFEDIYPRKLDDSNFTTIALFEEVGELAEAMRVFDRHPHYFYGEAADVFTYIMGFANEHSIRMREKDGGKFDLEKEFLSRYPGLCINCGSRRCICPPIPRATIGRMAKEMPVKAEDIRIKDIVAFYAGGEEVSRIALSQVAGDLSIGTHLPFDRGELNATLVQLCLRLSEAVVGINPELSSKLRTEAADMSAARSESGSEERNKSPSDLLLMLREAWALLDGKIQTSIESSSDGVKSLRPMLAPRILIITANVDEDGTRALRLEKEQRAIQSAIDRMPIDSRYLVQTRTACTIDDFRRTLLQDQYDVIHFAGHADEQGLAFCTDDGGEGTLPYDALAPLLSRQSRLKCVILNACHTMTGIEESFAPLIVGMVDEIGDDAAVEFARGFYDNIAVGASAQDAFEGGRTCMITKQFPADHVTKLTKKD